MPGMLADKTARELLDAFASSAPTPGGGSASALGAARLSVQAMKEAKAIAGHGHRGASSDVGVAIALLAAGQRGALLNVRINLGSIDDAAYASAVKTEVERLAAEASSTAAAAEG